MIQIFQMPSSSPPTKVETVFRVALYFRVSLFLIIMASLSLYGLCLAAARGRVKGEHGFQHSYMARAMRRQLSAAPAKPAFPAGAEHSAAARS